MNEIQLFEMFIDLARHIVQYPNECINCPNVGFCEVATKLFFQHLSIREIVSGDRKEGLL